MNWAQFFSYISSFLVQCERQHGVANVHYCEFVMERLTTITQGIENVISVIESDGSPTLNQIRTSLHELHQCICGILQLYQRYYESLDTAHSIYYSTPVQHNSRRGRPSYAVGREQIEYLRSMSFSWVAISNMLMISRMTLYRRRVEYGLIGSCAPISDSELFDLVQQIIRDHPYVGQSFVWGVIRSHGYEVTRERVRRAIRQSDPIGTVSRWGQIITPRQPYSVPGPNSLWHIDGNHKLIRWRLVCHGAIDGYSRMVVFLKCSNNNRSQTVYDLFIKAANRFGLPSRVRSDYGGENYLVARHMIRHRGQGRGSMLTGSSVHNQRIERLWVDMYRSVTIVYYRLFYHLEEQGLLDPLNEMHIFALHYIFIPRINHSLKCFQDGWNHHGIRTVRHLSPMQLYHQGIFRLQLSGLVALDFLNRVDSNYGVSNEDPRPEEHNAIDVPQSHFSVGERQLLHLQNNINPLQQCDDYGIELYLSTLQYIQSIASTDHQ